MHSRRSDSPAITLAQLLPEHVLCGEAFEVTWGSGKCTHVVCWEEGDDVHRHLLRQGHEEEESSERRHGVTKRLGMVQRNEEDWHSRSLCVCVLSGQSSTGLSSIMRDNPCGCCFCQWDTYVRWCQDRSKQTMPRKRPPFHAQRPARVPSQSKRRLQGRIFISWPNRVSHFSFPGHFRSLRGRRARLFLRGLPRAPSSFSSI